MIRESVRQAFRLLWAHKMRSALTLFGLVWGTAAVIFLVGWGGGVRIMLETGFAKTGKNLAQVWPGRIGEDFTPAVDRRHLWFTWEDMLAVRRRARLPALVGAERRDHHAVSYRQRALNVEVRGVEPVGIEIRGTRIAAGRQITQADLDHRRRVVVLGAKAREKLVGPGQAIGSRVRIAGRSFDVIGVHEAIGTQLGRDGDEIDDQAWVPITTHFTTWPTDWTTDRVIATMLLRLRDKRLVEETEDEVRRILAARVGVSPTDDEAIQIWSAVEFLRRIPIDQQAGLMFALSATTLIIGGIGILNMMLDAVRERRREIGLRLAVGARRRDIIGQFFLETFVIVLLGGALGVVIGVGGCLGLVALDLPDLIPIPQLTTTIVLLAVGVMSAVGLTAGMIPAWRAAQIDPALTLRTD